MFHSTDALPAVRSHVNGSVGVTTYIYLQFNIPSLLSDVARPMFVAGMKLVLV